MTFGERLKVQRVMRGWTQSELAKRADVSVACVSLTEKSRRKPMLSTAFRFARALGISIYVLMREE